MVWNEPSEEVSVDIEDDQDDEDDEDGDRDDRDDKDGDQDSRLFTFEVAKTNEQDENVTFRQGFIVRFVERYPSRTILNSLTIDAFSQYRCQQAPYRL